MEKKFGELDKILNKNNGTSIGTNFSVSWLDFNRNIGPLILFFIISVVLSVLTSLIPFSGLIVSPLIGVCYSAYMYDERRGASKGINDFFKPFNKFLELFLTLLIFASLILIISIPSIKAGALTYFADSQKYIFENIMKRNFNFENQEMPYNLKMTILINAPFIIYTSMVLTFAPYFSYFNKVKPIEAIKLSFKMGNKHFFHIFILALFSFVLTFLGTLICCVGLLAAAPLVAILKYHSFSQITELETEEAPVFDFEANKEIQ